jgi:release factor glutamine methyltransferase
MSLVYPPEKDSYLFQKVLENEIENKDITCLEIGVGSGIQLQSLKKLGVKNIYGVDINRDAVKHCKKLGFNVSESNLFSNVEGKYDLIIFNPPYLPKTKDEDFESERITTGGELGSEIINEFLIQSKEHLEKKGKIFLLISSLTKGINWLDFEKKLVGEKKLFFEKLEVWELKV